MITDPGHDGTIQETLTSQLNATKHHLLLGLSELPTYTPPAGTRVHTDSGHSKVWRARLLNIPVLFCSSHFLDLLVAQYLEQPTVLSARQEIPQSFVKRQVHYSTLTLL
jgi:hypothetical protein